MGIFNRLLRAVKRIVVAFLIMGALVALLFYYIIYHAPMVPSSYANETETGGPIEAAYLALGGMTVKAMKEKTDKPTDRFVAYYPEEMEKGEGKYPVVMVVNGTGVFANKAKALFEHLASWGFIVVGNHDGNTASGASAKETMAHLIELNETEGSVFYGKVDTAKMGITGHSQGGSGVVNVLSDKETGGMYKCAVVLSPVDPSLAGAINMGYDASKVRVPVLLMGGTEKDVISLAGLDTVYAKMPVEKVMARRVGAGHEEMLYSADGYVTAWMMYYLKDDEKAGRAFWGEVAELDDNALYCDQKRWQPTDSCKVAEGELTAPTEG